MTPPDELTRRADPTTPETPEKYAKPKMEEFLDPICPRCKCCEMFWEECDQCGGDGYRELYEDDPLWYDEGDTEDCDGCLGKGGRWVCFCDENGKHESPVLKAQNVLEGK